MAKLKAKLKKVKKHLKGDMKMFTKERAEDKELLKKLSSKRKKKKDSEKGESKKHERAEKKAKSGKKVRGYEREEREYVDQLPTEVGGQEEQFANVKVPGKKRVANSEKKATKVSYRAQKKSKKVARYNG